MNERIRPLTDRPARILLVEDSTDEAFLLSTLLEQIGSVEVTLAQDGVRALELLGSRPYDLVITDLNLPGKDGFAIIREIGARLPDTPVVAVTGYSNPAWLDGADRPDVDVLLTKPVDREKLARGVRELLGDASAPGGDGDDDAGGEPEARGDDAPSPSPRIVAVGLTVDDLVLGCGGSLAAHRAAGHEVVVTLLVDTGPAMADDEARIEPLADRVEVSGNPIVLSELVDEIGPRLVYLPSPRDDDRERRLVLDRLHPALAAVPMILAYPSPTSTLDFLPTTYRDIGQFMTTKLAALDGSPILTPEFASAHAVYWGRFAGFTRVEPFEVLRDRAAQGAGS